MYCLKYNKNPPKSYIFTDNHHLVLKQIENNLFYNGIDICEDLETLKSDQSGRTKVFVSELDWTDLENFKLISSGSSNIDMIVASGKGVRCRITYAYLFIS